MMERMQYRGAKWVAAYCRELEQTDFKVAVQRYTQFPSSLHMGWGTSENVAHFHKGRSSGGRQHTYLTAWEVDSIVENVRITRV
jgi:hypothetical protein